ncbi:MAG: DinB family protein [Fimbriimonadaceae bacterium]|nr:DinB family protein [Chitinophagales bacterium]
MLTSVKPVVGEYPPYYLKYIERVPDGDIIEILSTQINQNISFLKNLPPEKLNYRYAEGKWTIKQIVQHLIDGERVFSYRALRFARNDKTALPGFEENEYADEAQVDNREFSELLSEFEAVRNATLCLLKSFGDEELSRTGIANDNPISVRSICYIIAGHELHHIAIIKERYL